MQRIENDVRDYIEKNSRYHTLTSPFCKGLTIEITEIIPCKRGSQHSTFQLPHCKECRIPRLVSYRYIEEGRFLPRNVRCYFEFLWKVEPAKANQGEI